jgi:riboflavin kinase / FMN adenylyltransferase
MMKHIHGFPKKLLKKSWVTIGSFDGVHLGHQHILRNLTANANNNNALAVVVTFYPHPMVVLRGPRESFYLSTINEKAKLLGETGVDYVMTHPFDQEISKYSAETFVKKLKDHLNMEQLWIGYDFSLGHNREGNFKKLTELGKKFNYKVVENYPITDNEEIISSTLIRKYLGKGNIARVEKLLGRTYTLKGKVVLGDQRGRTIGVPTANISIPDEIAVPKAGVYACIASINGKSYQSVTNIGVRPTFEKDPVPPRVEVHLLDFKGDIYGETLQISLIEFLRPEIKFDGIESLVSQINKDILKGKGILAKIGV